MIGDRAYGSDPERVARLARAVCEGLLEGGVLPVIKHIPGHGRASVDSHHACPVGRTGHDELSRTDFAPFRALADDALGDDRAHRLQRRSTPTEPATLSRRVIAEIIRGEIGFDGVLVSDDLSMRALGGTLGERTRRALAAGCDLALHCNGDSEEMEEVAAAASPISAAAPRTARARRGDSAVGPRQADSTGETPRHNSTRFSQGRELRSLAAQ